MALVKKELQQTFADKRIVAVLVVLPVIQIIVLGFAVHLEVDNVPTLVADEDHTPQSREFVAGLLAGDAFTRVGALPHGEDALGALQRGEASLVAVIPPGFAQHLTRGEPAAVQFLVDGTDSNRAIVAQNAAVSYAIGQSLQQMRARVAALAQQRGQPVALHTLRVEPRVLYNPQLVSALFYVPGVAASLLFIVTFIITAMGLAREKETGTLEQILVTPLTSATLILGKTLPYAGIGLVVLGLVVAAGAWIFGVPVRGSLLLIFGAGALYLLAVLGSGLLVSAAVQNQQQALMMGFFLLLPALLLSGFMTPVENMPAWLQPLTMLNPVRHFVEIMRAVLLKSATAADVASQLLALALLGLAMFGAASWVVRRRLA
jgi:ABC-2 type transport system permease protein